MWNFEDTYRVACKVDDVALFTEETYSIIDAQAIAERLGPNAKVQARGEYGYFNDID